MSMLVRLLKRLPYVRRPFFQRDAARAELETVRRRYTARSAELTADARRLFPAEWHFVLPDDDARQNHLVPSFRDHIRAAIGKHTPALEIGPSFNPVLRKADGYNLAILDHATRDELIAKYRGANVDMDQIEPVDFIWQQGSFSDATGGARYDAVIACHVIEHAPDFVGFLNSCSEILTQGGTIHLLVPDKRFCFDFFQPVSDVAKVLGDHHAGRTRHSFEALYRNGANVKGVNGIGWAQDGVSGLHFTQGDPRFAHNLARTKANSADYVDSHENHFTPMSFMMLIDELRYLGKIGLELKVLTRARGPEFLAVLGKSSGARANLKNFLERKMCAYRIMMIEEAERIASLRP